MATASSNSNAFDANDSMAVNESFIQNVAENSVCDPVLWKEKQKA